MTRLALILRSGMAVVALIMPRVCVAEFEAGAEPWQPPPPMPDEFDWVQLTSGEWLKGEIIALYQENLEFDSDKLKLLDLEWDDIQQVRSAGTMQVGFGKNKVAVGKIYIDGETVRVMGDEDRQYPRSTIVTITAGAPKEINHWSMKASVGANLRKGNSEQIEIVGTFALVRRSTLNRISLDYLTIFNETDGEKVADSQRLTPSWTRYVSKRLFWTPLFGEWFRDPFQNISHRWTLGIGVGREIIDSAKIDWEIAAGPAYQTTRFYDVPQEVPISVETPAFVINTVYDQEVTGWLDFLLDYQGIFADSESGTYSHHLVSGIELELTSLLSFDVTLIWDRIQDPQPDSVGDVPDKDDLRLILALALDL